MPGVERFSINELVAEASELRAVGVEAVILFGIPAAKDETGSGRLSTTRASCRWRSGR